MADEIKAAGIEKFDGTDFGYWKMQIEDYLCCNPFLGPHKKIKLYSRMKLEK